MTDSQDITMAEHAEIANEIMQLRCELIDLQRKTGGCVSIKLKAENVEYCYNPGRKTTNSNPNGEKFFLTGFMRGTPVILNESDVLLDLDKQ